MNTTPLDPLLALSPCPFCGGRVQFRKALFVSDGCTDAIIHAEPNNCGMTDFTTYTADQSVITAWNTRAANARGDEVTKLRAFAQDVMEDWWEGDLDGGSRQDMAEKHGLIEGREATEACGEYCRCAEYDDFPQTCYRRTELLTGPATPTPGSEVQS